MRGYSIGDRILNPQYGTGTIRLLDEYHTVIDFDEHGIRRFSTPMVKLEKSDTIEPGKPAKRTRKAPVKKTAAEKAEKAEKAAAAKSA